MYVAQVQEVSLYKVIRSIITYMLPDITDLMGKQESVLKLAL